MPARAREHRCARFEHGLDVLGPEHPLVDELGCGPDLHDGPDVAIDAHARHVHDGAVFRAVGFGPFAQVLAQAQPGVTDELPDAQVNERFDVVVVVILS